MLNFRAAQPHVFNTGTECPTHEMFNVVLIEPEIPPNTGNIGRLCLATCSTLHLVKPLGFSLEDRQSKQPWAARYFFLTTKSGHAYYDVKFHQGDFLVFGRETKGLPKNLLASSIDNCLTIPMHGTRSLNLA